MNASNHAVRVFAARRIVTMDGSAETHGFAVRDGVVVATGEPAQLTDRFAHAEQVDLGGALVLPGFNDAHCHVSQAALQQVRVDLSSARTAAEVVAALQRRSVATPDGSWVVGQGLDEHAIDGAIDRGVLDTVSTATPVLVMEYTFHRAVVNSAGLEALGYRRPSDAPSGGQLVTDPAGHLNGWLFERAWLDPWLPGTGTASIASPGPLDAQLAALEDVDAKLHSLGITSYCDAIVSDTEEKLYRAALEQGRLTPRVNMLLWHSYLPDAGLPDHPDPQHLRYAGVKMMLDGALSGGTCLCADPYPSSTGNTNGLQILTDEEFSMAFERAAAAGARVAVHANGDRAVEKVIDEIRRRPPSDTQHRIEHCSIVDEQLLARAREQHVIAVPFGPFVHLFGEKILDFYGPERAGRICAHRSMLDAGLSVAGSSDYPIVPIDPLLALQSMVTRTTARGTVVGAQQRIEPLEAAWVYTVGSAHATGEEGFKGKLAPGFAADFTVLDRDITAIDPHEISQVPVRSTWIGGQCVWARSAV